MSYNTSNDTYTVDSGFPKTINSVRSETLVIAKDSTGKLWATWEQSGQIWVNRTTTNDAWGTPFLLPGAATANTDDISSIIAFGGKIGIFWSNQNANPDADFFAVHTDGTADTTGWAIETAYTGTNLADDHSNLKTDASGKVYAVVKTSLDNAGSSPLIVLLDRATNGTWANHLVSASSFDQTRPILEIDETNGLLRVFATSGGSGGTINQHTSPIGSIAFDGGAGTVVIKDASALKINNPTSTKQNITASTGLIVMGYNDTTRNYWHADVLSGAPPTNTPPTANATSATTPQNAPVSVPLSGSDPETCELTFSIVASPAHGTLGSISSPTCTSGIPNNDSATVTYTPTSGYNGPDSFTYKVNDGTANSAPATATLTVTPTGGGGGGTFTFQATEDAQVKSTSPTTNYGALATLQLREEASPGVTYRDYLKFNVTGMTGSSVTAVKLRLWITDVSPDSGTVFGTSTAWSEGSIVWNGAPALGPRWRRGRDDDRRHLGRDPARRVAGHRQHRQRRVRAQDDIDEQLDLRQLGGCPPAGARRDHERSVRHDGADQDVGGGQRLEPRDRLRRAARLGFGTASPRRTTSR